MHFGPYTAGPASARGDSLPARPSAGRPKFRTPKSRRLVEEYWESVVHSKVERPLYHTYSDRYGGTRGIPYAARLQAGADTAHTADGRTAGAAAACPPPALAEYMAASERAISAGDVDAAQHLLQQALTHLQNNDGGLTISALASTARLGSSSSPAGRQHSRDVGEVMRRQGAVALLRKDPHTALTLFDLSIQADPLAAETYALRAACYENLKKPAEAFVEYEKYIKLAEPSLKVLAHCGKCAAEAGSLKEAEEYLLRLLARARAAALTASVAADGRDDDPAFYEAHAYFYLGVVEEQHEGRGAASPQAQDLFARAASNAAYVESYEHNVDEAVLEGEYALAQHLLSSLQKMGPDCATYFLRAAHVYHLTGDTNGELVALSEALDRHQGLSARRMTLLTRGTVYADKAADLDRAIQDYTVAISIPSDDTEDRCTPVAYLKRAEVLRRRFTRSADAEDQTAALSDYAQFLQCLRPAAAPCPPPTDATTRTFDERDICAPQDVTDALLLLASGAFRERNYEESVRRFAQAVARGWQPQRRAPQIAAWAGAGATSLPTDGPLPHEHLYEQFYLAMAHDVTRRFPVQEDMFLVPYEPRDWSGGAHATASAAGEASATRRAPANANGGVSAAGAGKSVERKDTEHSLLASFPLSYSLVDARYTGLRALEPTVFSRLEDAFLDAWGPYRTEVEKTREETLSARSGKRLKRHA